MINKFPKVQTFYSFKKEETPYTLFKVKDEIISRFHNLLNKLESQSQTILCTRGDSKENIEEHNDLFTHNLNKIFTVGAKSIYNTKVNDDIEKKYQHTYTNNKNTLHEELRSLIKKANEAMNKREEEFSMKTLQYFTKLNLDNFDIESLFKLKIFFLSFFHTDGRLREFSNSSPFLSMTYGKEKFSIARKFALGKDNPKEKAFVYLYSLNAGDPYYMKTNNLSKELRKEGAKWHYDKYHEVLLINGMFPHYMLGIFEVEKNKTPKFIINPYLYEILEKSEQFDYINGLPINQKDFTEYALELGYKSYFYTTKENKTYTGGLDNSSSQEVVIP